MSISETFLFGAGIGLAAWCAYEAVKWAVAIWLKTPTPTERVQAFLSAHPDEEFGGADIMDGAHVSGGLVYVALSELQHQGRVESRWEVLPAGVSRPRRRFYRAVRE